MQVLSEKISAVKQAALNLNLNVKKTRKQLFLEQMELVVAWTALVLRGQETEAFWRCGIPVN